MSIIQIIEADIEEAWGDIKAIVVDDAKVAWAAIKTIWLTLVPGEWVIIEQIVNEALEDVKDGDYGDLVTSVLNKAEAAGHDFVLKLSSEVLTVIVGIFKASPKAAS